MHPLNASSLTIVILAGGESRRMLSQTPKVLHRLGGRPVLAYVLEKAHALQPAQIIVVASPTLAQNKAFLALLSPSIHVVLQERALGTGDAVRQAIEAKDIQEPQQVLVLFGDTPLLSLETLQKLLNAQQGSPDSLVVLGVRPPNPSGYGRLLTHSQTGHVLRIVEEKDADAETRAIPFVNGGVMLLAPTVLPLLNQLTPQNQAGEYYLTELVALGAQKEQWTEVIEAPFEEVQGINTRAELSQAETTLQQHWRMQALAEGVTLMEPASTFFSFDTHLSPDVTLFPHVYLGPGVSLAEGVVVLPFSVLENTIVHRGARVGPFCHLREQTVLGEDTIVGNFVEIKKSTLDAGAMAKHLSYLGDATVGAKANIGAGTITCNYDGKAKHTTVVGARAFIGCNTALIAPVSIGEGARVGAGSVITKDVPAETLAIGRARQENLPRKG